MNLFVNPGNALVTTDKDDTTDAEAMALIHNQLTGYAGEIVLAELESNAYLIGFENEVKLSLLNNLLSKLQALKNVSSAEQR